MLAPSPLASTAWCGSSRLWSSGTAAPGGYVTMQSDGVRNGSDWLSRFKTQIRWGTGYIKAVYGNPRVAWQHSLDDGSYAPAGRWTLPVRCSSVAVWALDSICASLLRFTVATGALHSPGHWPLVGRDDLVDSLLAGTHSPGALLYGAPGVGKSRLAREVVSRQAVLGSAVVVVRATASASTIPLGALASTLPPAAQGNPAAGLDALQEASTALVARAGARRLLLCVDDMDLLDAASATVVHGLVSTGAAGLVGTMRSLVDGPDAVLALWKDEGVERVPVLPLGSEEVRRLVEHAVGGRISVATGRRMCELSGGNPLLLRELVLDATSSNALREDDEGWWHWHGQPEPGPELTELVIARLGRLDQDDRDVLELLALGEPLPLAALQELGPGGSIDGLERRGLVEVTHGEGAWEARLAHPLYSQVLRTALPAGRRLRLHRRLALGMATYWSGRRSQPLRLAYWSLESDLDVDPKLLIEAAWDALRRFDVVVADRYATAAGADGGPVAELLRGIALDGDGRYIQARQVLSRLLAAAPGDDIAAQAASALAHSLAYGLGQPGEAKEVLTRVRSSLSDPFWAASLQADLADLLLSTGEIAEPSRLAVELLDDPDLDVQVRLRAVWPAEGALSMGGRQDDAVACALDVLPVPQRRTALSGPASRALVSHVLALMYAGRLIDAYALATAGLAEATASGNWRTHGMWANLVGWVELRRGRPSSARLSLLEAAALMRERDPDELLGFTLALVGQASATSGNLDAARRAGNEAQRWLSGRPRPFNEAMAGALAWIPAAAGELSRARRSVLAAADAAVARGARGIALHLVHDALRFDGGRVVARLVASTAAGQQGAWAPAFGIHAAATLSGQGRTFAEASAAFEEMGALLHAAETAAQAATAFARAGHPAPALAAAARSRRLAATCEDACVALPPHLPSAEELTAREREVCALAARGLSNAAIAASMFVSVRTVEGHLYQAFAKPGVTHRQALRAVLELPTVDR